MASALPSVQTQIGESRVVRVLCSVAIAGAIGIFAYYATKLFLKYPPVWPDEVIYANPAINLVRRGLMSSDDLGPESSREPSATPISPLRCTSSIWRHGSASWESV